MKKTIYIISLFTLVTILMTSCEKKPSTEDNSIITHYVTFELDGDEVMTIAQGTAYDEPGYVALEGETDVTTSVEIEGEVDANTVGLYTLEYVAENADGFESSVERTVIVYDPAAPATDISGVYSCSVERIDPNEAYNDLEIEVNYIAPGFFEFSDLLGGFYAQGREYGSNYAMHGYLKLNADNTLDYISSFIRGWGDSLDGISDGSYNPGTGEISFTSSYIGGRYEFIIVLTP